MDTLGNFPPRKLFRLVMRAVLLIYGAVAAFLAAVCIQLYSFKLAGIFALGATVATLGEFVLADIITEKRYPSSTENLLRNLEHNLREIDAKIFDCIRRAIETLQACDKSQISGTFHLVAELYSISGDGLEKVLVQVTDYSGNYGGKKWRFTNSTKGLIGRCLRTGQTEWVNFRTHDEYRYFMVRDFGFSEEEVARHTQQARSYWATPVYALGRVVGVIFLFSTEVQAFPIAANAAILDGISKEIAAYLERAQIV